MDYLETAIEIYAVGGFIFAAYNTLEIASIQRQFEISRDKNLKNALTAQAKQNFDDIKHTWAWPYQAAKSAVSAIKWVKSLTS